MQPGQPVNEPDEQMALFDNAQTLDISPSQKIITECTGCRLARDPLVMSSGISNAERAVAATAQNIKQKRAFRGGSVGIYDPNHATIKEHNDFFNRVSAFWMSLTVPLAALRQDQDANDKSGRPKVEGGTRLIRKTDMSMFHTKMKQFSDECKIIEGHLNRDRASILAASREMLGNRYDDSYYPERFEINIFWGFPNVEVPRYYEQLAPEAYEHERQQVARRMEQTAELDYADFLKGLSGVISHWVDRLGPKIRIHPSAQSPYAYLHRAEVLQRITVTEDKTLTADQVKLKVRYKKGRDTIETTVGPMTESEYAAMMPQTDNSEPKQFKDSTVENMMEQLDRFERLGDLICPSDNLKNIAQDIRQHLAQLGRSSDIAGELRNSTTFKTATLQLMEKMSTRLESEVITVKTGRKVIRNFNQGQQAQPVQA